jgi:hypothetical protein
MTSVYLALGYLLLCAGTVGLLLFLRARSRQDRAPFPDNTRLLRGPGESHRQRLAALDEQALNLALLFLGLPAIGYGALLHLAARLAPGFPISSALLIWLGLAGLLAAFYLGARRLIPLIDRRRNTQLGHFGERVVAEHLEPLKAAGYRVFHDLPAADTSASGAAPARDSASTIDHVVVGPAGVFAIETKTRRKGRARVGFMAHEIIFDGDALAYPWGEDRHGLDQAHRQAEWLARHLANQTGRAVPVHALLVFPGWSILRKGRGPVHVLSPRELPDAIQKPTSTPVGLPGQALTPADLELVLRELDARCRDVEL